MYFICIIPSHLHIYSLFSNRCSGEPVWPCVSSLKYRFNLEILYTLYALHDTYHLIYAYYSLFSNRCSGEPVWPCVSSLKYRRNTILVYFICITPSHLHIYSLFSNRCYQCGRAWVPIQFWNTVHLYALHDTYHLIYAYYSLFSNRCSGEPVWPCVSSLKYRFNQCLEILYTLYALPISDIRILRYFLIDVRANQCGRAVPWSMIHLYYSIGVFYMHNTISFAHLFAIF